MNLDNQKRCTFDTNVHMNIKKTIELMYWTVYTWWCTNNAPNITGDYLLDLGANDYHGGDNNSEITNHCKCQIRKWFGVSRLKKITLQRIR